MRSSSHSGEHYFSDAEISQDQILKYFDFYHLQEDLGSISRIFAEAAEQILVMVPRNAERTVALRKLVEAKDCAVRATLP